MLNCVLLIGFYDLVLSKVFFPVEHQNYVVKVKKVLNCVLQIGFYDLVLSKVYFPQILFFSLFSRFGFFAYPQTL